MQIYALDATDSLISTRSAKKQQDYTCMECKRPVRLRSGSHRQPHFYHLQPNSRCTLHAKGMAHLMLQHHLKVLIPEVQLECRFPSISRIADAAWHARKLVFEVQCSPISAEEVRGRIHSYRSIEYQLIWIFHDNRYNQDRLTSAEDLVQSAPHYFSNIDAQGHGMIYDQLSLVQGHARTFRLPKLPINPSRCYFRSGAGRHADESKHPGPVHHRLVAWPCYFHGDLVHRLLDCDDRDPLNQLLQAQIREWASRASAEMDLPLWHLMGKVKHAYQLLLKFFLEKACQ